MPFHKTATLQGHSRVVGRVGAEVSFMTLRLKPLSIAVGMAAVLWVVPSVGTQGIGTLGQRFSHPDRRLMGIDGDTELHRADATVEAALAR